MSRRIFKSGGTQPNSSSFQFNPSHSPTDLDGLSDLEAQAELDAFQESGPGGAGGGGGVRRPQGGGGAPGVDVEELIERAEQDAERQRGHAPRPEQEHGLVRERDLELHHEQVQEAPQDPLLAELSPEHAILRPQVSSSTAALPSSNA